MAEKNPKISKEEAIKSAWRRGLLSWKLRPEQKHLRDLISNTSTDFALFNISRRLGKSTTCSLFCIEEAIKRKQIILYTTAFLTDLTNFIIPIFDMILSDCPEDMRPKYRPSKKEYHFNNGSIIRLAGLDKNSDALRGNAIEIIIFDEAGFVNNLKYVYESVVVPATMKRKFKTIFISTPPESPEHYFASELIPKAKLRSSYIEMTIDAISDLTPEERKRVLDEVGGELSVTAQREFFCKIIVDTERAVAPTFNRELHIKEFEYPTFANWLTSIDTGGVRDKTAAIQVAYDYPSKRVRVYDERAFVPNTPTSQWLQEVKAMERGTPTRIVDASGQLLIDISSLGYAAMLPRKDEFHASLQFLRMAFFNNEIEIHPRCKFLIQTLEGGLLNRTRTDFERTETLGHCDAVMALVYALRHVDKNNPIPLHAIGISTSTHWIPPIDPPKISTAFNPHQRLRK